MDLTIVKRAHAKRKLEKVVLQKGRFTASQKALSRRKVLDVEEIKEILKKQESQQFQCRTITDEMIDDLLNRDKIFSMSANDPTEGSDSGIEQDSEGAKTGDFGFFEVFNLADD